MATEPLSERELAALHDRISRDIGEVRRRMRRWTRDGHGRPDDVLKSAVDTFRMIRALRAVAPGAGLAILVIAGIMVVRRARRLRR